MPATVVGTLGVGAVVAFPEDEDGAGVEPVDPAEPPDVVPEDPPSAGVSSCLTVAWISATSTTLMSSPCGVLPKRSTGSVKK